MSKIIQCAILALLTFSNAYAEGLSKIAGADLIYMPAPKYPAFDRLAKHTGRVRLEYTITASGDVINAKVIKSSGWPSLDKAALKATKKWRFSPKLDSSGEPVQSIGINDVVFDPSLENYPK